MFFSFPKEIQLQLAIERDPHGNVQLSKIETERLLISLVERELKERNASVNFNPQPLFCGYEGRAGLPSNFDASYCYTLGHGAALLILHQASGFMCCIKNLTEEVEAWKFLGVPLVSMLHFEMRKNKKKAVIKKALVDLEGAPFKTFLQLRNQWKLEDHYLCPGPLQFEGPKEVSWQLPITLHLESNPGFR